MKKLSVFEIFFHVLGWSLFFLAPVILSPGPLFHRVSSTEMMSLALRSLLLMIYFYGNLFYITPVLLRRRGAVVFTIVSVVLILTISYLNSSFHHFYVLGREPMPPTMNGDFPPPSMDRFPGGPPDGFRDGGPPMMFVSPTFSSLLITTLVGIISSMLVFWQEWNKVHAEKQEQALQRVAAELTALKLQISPHFLFNTLNNIRWLVRSKAESAEDAVVKLSHLLRYILYQTDKEKVDLKAELDHLLDFIELQKMRIENPDAIDLTMDGDFFGRLIVPLLLLPLTENFFKHADFSEEHKNKISIAIRGAALVFKTENKIAQAIDGEKGIGLNNVTKRLNLHYPNRYLLNYEEKNGVFFLQLELIL